jgi:glycerol-3-phosphate acyltransferase PlsX
MKIALDAMGGDHAPKSVIRGANEAVIRNPELSFIFFGKSEEVEPLLTKFPKLAAKSEFVHTDVAISGHDKPSQALRQGKNSSMQLDIDAVKDGRADAVVSGGNTGALMAMS